MIQRVRAFPYNGVWKEKFEKLIDNPSQFIIFTGLSGQSRERRCKSARVQFSLFCKARNIRGKFTFQAENDGENVILSIRKVV